MRLSQCDCPDQPHLTKKKELKLKNQRPRAENPNIRIVTTPKSNEIIRKKKEQINEIAKP